MGTVSEPGWMMYVSFATSIITLIVLIYYAWLTKRIAEASNEQAEGLSKPALFIKLDNRLPTDREYLEETFNASVQGGYLEVMNIGNGPAIKVYCEVKSRTSSSAQGIVPKMSIPYLCAKDSLPLPLMRTSLTAGHSTSIELSYRSLNGKEHAASFKLSGDNVETLEFR